MEQNKENLLRTAKFHLKIIAIVCAAAHRTRILLVWRAPDTPTPRVRDVDALVVE